MRFLDTRPFLIFFFMCGCVLALVAVLVIIQGITLGMPFRWAAVPFVLYGLWGAYSSGRRLFKGLKPPEDGGPP